MRAAALICMVLLMDNASAQETRKEDFALAQDGRLYSNHTLDCEEGSLVLVLDIEIRFDGPPCCLDSVCLFPPSAADFQRYLAACGNTSLCSLSVQDPQRQCGGNITSPQSASVSFACSSASEVLVMDRPGSTSGRTVAARFSSPDRQSRNSSWQCRVEASDCSNLTSTVKLLIRNTERQSSSFFFTTNVERLGSRGLQRRETTSITPFTVDLHLVAGSHVQPAYVLGTAAINISMTCGIRNATPLATFCNQCASSPCQEGFECVNLPGNFSCVAAPTAETTLARETTTPKNSAVAPAVGVGVAALVVIAGTVAIACTSRKWSQKKRDEEASLPSLETSPRQDCPNNAHEELSLPEHDGQQLDCVRTASAVTSESDSPYDVLFQKRSAVDPKRDVIYGHLDQKGSPNDHVEGKNICAGNTTGPGVTPDPVYFTVEPESPAAQAKQDDGSNLKVGVKAASLQNA